MLKVLFLEDHPPLLDRIAYVLESIAGVEVSRASDRAQALSEIQSRSSNANGTFDLFIIDSHLTALNAMGDLQKAVGSGECIVCVDSLQNMPDTAGWNIIATLERPFAPRLLQLQVEQWSKGKQSLVADESATPFVRIGTKLLIDISPLLSDIYVKLSDTKYIKLFREGDVFDAQDLERYAEKKKIQFMYLRADQCQEFTQRYIQFIEKLIRDSKPLSLTEVSVMHRSIHETVQELVEKVGFNPDVQSLAKSQIQLTLKMMGRRPSLKAILKHLEEKSGLYSSDHSFLTGYLACAIASQLAYGSEITFNKLTLAAFMHDVTLKDESIVDCETIEDAKTRNPTESVLDTFSRHPFKVAEMIRQMSEIPADVDSIVAQHHELPDGSGFPRGLTAKQISPLAMIFMVAHAVAKDVLKEPTTFSLQHSLEQLALRFPQNSFKKILTAASDLVI